MILALNGVLRSYGGERGDELISAATIMLSFMQIITLPLGGISGGTQPALSYNYGANRPDRVKSCEGWILTLCILYTVALFLVARFAAAPVVAVFTSDAGAETGKRALYPYLYADDYSARLPIRFGGRADGAGNSARGHIAVPVQKACAYADAHPYPPRFGGRRARFTRSRFPTSRPGSFRRSFSSASSIKS